MTPKELLESIMVITGIHAHRLESALSRCASHFPINEEAFNNLDETELAFIEMMTSRFAKLQDICGQKIFPILLKALEEDTEGKSFIDILNQIEKIGFIDDSHFWLELRKTRNSIAHEYPDNPQKMILALNDVYTDSQRLITYWKSLETHIQQKVFGA